MPLNPASASLNLAQAVLIVGYEWFQAGDATPARVERWRWPRAPPAEEARSCSTSSRSEAELDDCGFLRNAGDAPDHGAQHPGLFMRAGLMTHEVRTLHGIVTGLTERRMPHGAGAGCQPVRRPRKLRLNRWKNRVAPASWRVKR